jgi:predicted amidohydrolase YtcJ
MPAALLKVAGVRLARIEGGELRPGCLDELRAFLAAAAVARPRGFVFGFGLCVGALSERRLPSATELDSWLPGREVVVLSHDGHSSSFTTLALKRLGLEAFAEDGVLTGEAHETNMGRIQRGAMSGVGIADLARGISGLVSEAASEGVARIHCLEGLGEEGPDPIVDALALAGPRLPIELRLYLQYTSLERVMRRQRIMGRRRVGGCVAWEMDGSISSRTAAFDRPYLDRGGTGRLYRTAEEAFALMEPFHRAGYQVSTHAIGPRGIESALVALERLLADEGSAARDRRHRIEHFEFPRPDQVERAGRLGIVTPVQPGFAWFDARYVHSYEHGFDEGTLALFTPLRSLLEAGAIPALSTDSPVQPIEPFVQVAGAVEHPVASERLSVFEALRAATFGGAYAAFDEGDAGTIEPGKRADLALLDRDPFETPPEKIHEIRAIGTWKDGKPLVAPPPGLAGFVAAAFAAERSRM